MCVREAPSCVRLVRVEALPHALQHEVETQVPSAGTAVVNHTRSKGQMIVLVTGPGPRTQVSPFPLQLWGKGAFMETLHTYTLHLHIKSGFPHLKGKGIRCRARG